MTCCAQFSILVSVGLDTPVNCTWSHSRYLVWRIVWLLSSPLPSAQSGTSASGEKRGVAGSHDFTWCHFTDYIIRLTSLPNPPTASTNAPGWSATCEKNDQLWLTFPNSSIWRQLCQESQLIHVTPSNPWSYHYPLILLCVIEVLVAKQHQNTCMQSQTIN